MEEPLLRDHKTRERAPPDALGGKLHGSDPGAASSPIGDELAALNAKNKNRTFVEKANPPKNSEESPVREEIIEKKPAPPLDAEKPAPPLNAEKPPPPLSAEKPPPPLSAEKKPKNGDKNNSDVSKILQKGISKAVQGAPPGVYALAEAAETFARIQRGTELAPIADDFAGKAREFANKLDDPVCRDRLLQQVRVLSDAALDTLDAVDGADIFQLLGAAYTVLSLHQPRGCHPPAPAPSWPHEPAAVSSDKKQGLETPTLESLSEQASAFAKSAAGTSMAAAADAFCRAAEHFAGGKGWKKRVIETELNEAAMALFSVAQGAPSSEAGLATVAINLTHGAQMVLLSDSDSEPGVLAGWWRWRRASSTSGPDALKRPSLKQRLRAAISARDPMLPIYSEDEKQLVDKREVLYALALGAPVAILTAAAGLNVFPGAWASVAGASAAVWILAASGMVVNQYSVSDWERLAARHLGRLGVLGAGVLFCFFTYRAFFPSTSWAFWFLLAITAAALGFPWILSCIRGDDVISASTENALEMQRGEPARRRTV